MKDILISILCLIFAILLKLTSVIAPLLFLVFLVLKLCGVIAWSWFFICMPLLVWIITLAICVIITIID